MRRIRSRRLLAHRALAWARGEKTVEEQYSIGRDGLARDLLMSCGACLEVPHRPRQHRADLARRQQALYLLEGLRRRYPVVLFSAPETPLYDRARARASDVPVGFAPEADAGPWYVGQRPEAPPSGPPACTSHAHDRRLRRGARRKRHEARGLASRELLDLSPLVLRPQLDRYCYGVDRYLTVSSSVATC